MDKIAVASKTSPTTPRTSLQAGTRPGTPLGWGRSRTSPMAPAWSSAVERRSSNPSRGTVRAAAGEWRCHRAAPRTFMTRLAMQETVNGVAADAGFSLALACDFRALDESATFRQAYTSAGAQHRRRRHVHPPAAGRAGTGAGDRRIRRATGTAHAASAGLATRIAAAGEALDDARALACDLQTRPLASFASSKRLLRRSAETPLEVQLEHERAGIAAGERRFPVPAGSAEQGISPCRSPRSAPHPSWAPPAPPTATSLRARGRRADRPHRHLTFCVRHLH
jgi:hypothetical protein